jgi:DNA invertase Pin-like site-specific DNA recombinase
MLAVGQTGKVTETPNLDLTSSTGRLMFQLLGAFAEFERNMIRERVIAGLNHAKAKGRPGVDLDLMKLNEMRGQGLTMRAMADKLGVSLGLVHKTLSKCSSVGLDNSASKVEMAAFN